MSKISMDKKYKYKDGKPSRVLCTDGYVEKYPVISMDVDGAIYRHTANGLIFDCNQHSNQDLIEVWQPKKGEWCLFTSSHGVYTLRKFDCIVDGLYTDSHGSSWRFCYEFDGTLPHDINNENE